MNVRERDAQERGRTESERKERDILTVRAIKGLSRNIAVWKFPGILKDNPN